MFEAWNRPDKLDLDIIGQARGEAGGVELFRVPALWLEEDLMARLITKLNNLIFNRRAIAGTNSLNSARIEWRPIEVPGNDCVRFCGRPRNPTGKLFHVEHPPIKAEDIVIDFFGR